MKKRALPSVWHLLSYLVVLLPLSCGKSGLINQQAVEGLWMGGAYQLDLGEYPPFTKILEFTNDGQFIEKRAGEGQPDTFDYDFREYSLHIDTFEYKLFDLKRVGEELHWGKHFTRYYQKIHPATDLDAGQVAIWLQQKNWQLGPSIFQFTQDGQFWEATAEGDFCRQYCYSLETYKGHLFIIKKGNHLNCNYYIQYLEQVIEANASEIIVIRWQGNGFETVRYQALSKNVPCSSAPFQLCNKYLYVNYPKHRYYYKGTVYQGGLYQINKFFRERYRAPKDSDESGLIRVRFIVNCEGKAGRFEILELNNDYEVKQFDSAISQQILDITKDLQDWIPGRDNGMAIDTYKYLTFKIKNGAIVEIFP